MPPSLHNVVSHKQVLEAQRDEKRKEMEDLFEQRQAIQNRMQSLTEELQQLDDEIDVLENRISIKEEQGTNVAVEEEEVGEVSQREILTDPHSLTLTMHPDEILTDVTQPTQQHPLAGGRDHHYNQVSITSGTAASSSSNNGIGPLHLKPVPPARAKRALSGNQTNTAAAARPAGTLGTLDSFLIKPPPPRSSTARVDSLQSLSVPQDRGGSRPQDAATANPQFPWSHQVHHLLRHTFRLQNFRDHQLDIINATLSGRDVFVLMRTGGGKSLTYQLPALVEAPKVTLVVSPLISLIRDQEEQMNAIQPGSALSLTSGISRDEQTRRWNVLRNPNGGVVMLFVTPEKVSKSNKLKNELEKLAAQNRLGRFVIDECHCACQWGHDFRPDYTKLGVLKTHFPSVPLLAVTATASDRVRADVADILRLSRGYDFFRSSAQRPNLTYHVRPKPDGKDRVLDDMAEFIQTQHARHAGIVYTFSRKEADTVADQLCERGIVARSYHSGVSDSQKEAIHQSWMRNETQVVVATIAFGLGINKPDVRFVLHHSLSKSLEAYYQESGRAGRNGEAADCILYYAPKDVARMIGMIHGDNGEPTFWSMVRYAQQFGNDAVCKAILMKALGEPNSDKLDEIVNRNSGETTETRSVGKHAQTVTRLLQHKMAQGVDLTIPMLVKEWRAKPANAPEFVKENPPGKELTADECERIIVCLILEDIISPNVIYTAYSATMYLKPGRLANNLINAQNPRFDMPLPKRQEKAASTRKKAAAKKATPDSADGWFDKNEKKPRAKNKRPSSRSGPSKRAKTTTMKTTKSKKTSVGAKGKKGTKALKKKKSAVAEIIELDLSSSEDENSPPVPNSSLRRSTGRAIDKMRAEQEDDSLWEDELDSESDREFELE